MDRRRRAAALAGSGAAIAGSSGALLTRHAGHSADFLFGLIFGIAVGIFIVASIWRARGGAICSGG
jgi:hypothetical protein